MHSLFLKIYDYFEEHKRSFWTSFMLFIAILIAMTAQMEYSENIFDFLPLDEQTERQMNLYQAMTQGDKIVIVIHSEQGAEHIKEAIDSLESKLDIAPLQTQFRIDYDAYMAIPSFLYDHTPLFLTEEDYDLIRQRITPPDSIRSQLQSTYNQIVSPTFDLLAGNMSLDPLALFQSMLNRVGQQMEQMPFAIDEGYIFSPDHQYGIALVSSPYGAVESAKNEVLIAKIDSAAQIVTTDMQDIKIGITGAPIISVENARQIKQDSIWAISIAVTLILMLLLLFFRSIKPLGHIGTTILFGWLFAIAALAAVMPSISIIVLGIGSIIIGIAVNYPLHFMSHYQQKTSARDTLRELVSPLLTGNITTVGAFACLIPLEAIALHDLGLFASLMLVGTILFVLLFLPHFVRHNNTNPEERLLFAKLVEFNPARQRWIFPLILIITAVLGYFSFFTQFDANIQHVNYISDEQNELLTMIQSTAGPADSTSLYIVSEGQTWDEAQALLDNADSIIGRPLFASYFLPSQQEQEKRLARWRHFWEEHQEDMMQQLYALGPQTGFSATAFDDMQQLIDADYSTLSFDELEPLTSTLFQNLCYKFGDCHTIVQQIHTERQNFAPIEKAFAHRGNPNQYAFDFEGLNCSIANTLSEDFNYICFACAIVVFLFLWLSYRSLKFSLIAFSPMALGWIWILGLMYLFGIQFNIVNVILATFIFGQGDDYTIFMIDGLRHEYKTGEKILPSYKNSILMSALIMFIGMGSLIVAHHPALHSLAEVTIVGMSSVVFITWLLPPVLFKFFFKQ